MLFDLSISVFTYGTENTSIFRVLWSVMQKYIQRMSLLGGHSQLCSRLLAQCSGITCGRPQKTICGAGVVQLAGSAQAKAHYPLYSLSGPTVNYYFKRKLSLPP